MSETQQDGFGKIVADMRKAYKANDGFPISAAYLNVYADRVEKEAERMRKLAEGRSIDEAIIAATEAKEEWKQRHERFLDGILADLRGLRKEARQARKEYDDSNNGDPFAALFGVCGVMFLCGVQIGTSFCILYIKRRRAGRPNKKSFIEQLVRLAGMGKRMEAAQKEDGEDGE